MRGICHGAAEEVRWNRPQSPPRSRHSRSLRSLPVRRVRIPVCPRPSNQWSPHRCRRRMDRSLPAPRNRRPESPEKSQRTVVTSPPISGTAGHRPPPRRARPRTDRRKRPELEPVIPIMVVGEGGLPHRPVVRRPHQGSRGLPQVRPPLRHRYRSWVGTSRSPAVKTGQGPAERVGPHRGARETVRPVESTFRQSPLPQ